MSNVPAGARLILRTADRTVALRALTPAALTELWSIPVLAVVGQPLDGLAGQLEVPTDRGVLHLQAHLASDGGGLSLRPGLGVAPTFQRRDDVRADVRLPVRVLPAGTVRVHRADRPAPGAVDGTTVSVSAGGLGIRLAEPLPGGPLYAEVQLPEGRLVPAVLAVVAAGAGALHARFDRIEPADRERLVRLVFEQQRRELAARRRLLDAWPAWR